MTYTFTLYLIKKIPSSSVFDLLFFHKNSYDEVKFFYVIEDLIMNSYKFINQLNHIKFAECS